MRPLVSVVTGTYQRHGLLREAIEAVRAQTYRPLEHVIVADGPDPELREAIEALRRADQLRPLVADARPVVPIVFAELGFWASGFLAMSLSAAPFMVAQLLAHGELQMWLSDDERPDPDHVEALVDLLEATDSDFVYPRVACYVAGSEATPTIVGTVPPSHGQVANALYRRELLDYRGFSTHIGSGTDWDQVAGWVAAGAGYAMLDRVTITHRVDKSGEGEDVRLTRQPLRGLGGLGRYAGPHWKGRPIDLRGRFIAAAPNWPAGGPISPEAAG
jgi:glycosyltransferase involved in cell wall biosynthesis